MSHPNVKKIPPKTITEFRKYSEEPQEIVIPEVAKNRKCTDIGFVVFFSIMMLVTIVLTAYTSIRTDYHRFLYGYDKCGDTCGVKNDPIRNINCSGKDLTQKLIMNFKYYKSDSKSYLLPEECIKKCNESSQLYFHRCFPKVNSSLTRTSSQIKTLNEFVHDLRASVICICAMSSTGLVLSFGLFFCFRYVTHATVTSVLVLHILGLLCFTGYVWYWYTEDPKKMELIYIGTTAAVLAFFLSVFICYFHDRYSLVVQLFTEAMIAIFEMPVLLFQPLVAIILLSIVVTGTVFLSALISTNQILSESAVDPSIHEYKLSNIGISCLFFIVFVTIWIFAFANGCQCMIISGAVAAHYFTRNKPVSKSAVWNSFYVLIRYHLGTVVFGSLVITIVMTARILVEFLRSHEKCKNVVMLSECCLTCLQDFVDYLTKRAYIQTAMHGQSLCQSGMRAARLLWTNLMDTISLDVVGDFIMFCTLILVLVIAIGVGIAITYGEELVYFWAVLIVGAGATGTIIYFCTQVINIAIETIFLCFCEDKLLNDGKDRPYFMSPELKALIDKAKKAAQRREEQQ